MAHEHSSGLPAAYDRAPSGPARARMVWAEGVFVQGADLNEAQSLEARRNRRGLNMVAKDGDRIEGAEIFVNIDTETVTLGAGQVYVAGDVRPVAAAVKTAVAMTGETTIGVRLQRVLKTYEDDASLLGLHPGTAAEGEPGAAREEEVIVWALPDDEVDGDYYAVYLLRDGTVIDQQPPSALTGVQQQIARYDRDANGNYAVDGCEVIALGKVGSDQIFAIQAGTANIQGWKRIREASLRHAEVEAPDLEAIAAEPHTFTGTTGGSASIAVSRAPIQAVTAAVVVKRIVEVVTRGAVPGGLDDLFHSSVTEVESVVQGGTTYVAGTDYSLTGDAISWAPGGAEPAGSSTYTVTYLYNAAVTPDAVTDTHITVSGGVNGKGVLFSYTSKLPRIDLLCLDVTGRPVYVKGISARFGAMAPIPPSNVLKLAEIRNDWLGTPAVTNNGTRNYTYDSQRRLFNRLIDILDQFDRSEAERDILTREPVSKAGIFTDTFVDDFFRDQGAAQTAATNRGVLQLAVDDVLLQRVGNDFHLLDWTEEIVVSQVKRTSAMKINPYANFTAMPAALRLEPGVDFWTEEQTAWTSEVTREFMTAPDQPPGQTVINEVTEIRRQSIATLREIDVDVLMEGFGVGENLSLLTFDGIDVKPPGTQTADSNGEISLTFTIPAGVPTGRRVVRAEGAAGSFAQAIFVGEGTVDITTMRRVTLVARGAPVPPVVEPPPQPPVVVIEQPVVEWTPANFSEAIWGDPLAQTFALPEDRHISGIDVMFDEIGDPTEGVRIQLCTTQNGYPTNEVLAEAFINMNTVEVDEIIAATFDIPVYCRSDREYAFVAMTADDTHSLKICRLGDVDPVSQERVSAQPYTVGVLFSSSQRTAWTPHQDADLFFRIRCAVFAPTTKTVTLWSGAITNISDVLVRGAIEIPTDAARFRYELVRASGGIIPLAPGQAHQFSEFITETVTLRAVLQGSAKISPVLYPGTIFIGGRIRTTGTYITRQFPMGSAVDVKALFAALQPAGSSVTVEVDAVDDTWAALTADGSSALGGGWSEPRFKKTGYTAANGRIRLTLNGGPGARISLARLRAYSV